MIQGCTAAAFHTLPEAMQAKRAIKKLYKAESKCVLCEKCDHYHVPIKVGEYPIPARWKEIIELYAHGHERKCIAAQLKMSEHTVERMTGVILNHFYALNRSNLVAIAISLGIINPNDFVPHVEENCCGQ